MGVRGSRLAGLLVIVCAFIGFRASAAGQEQQEKGINWTPGPLKANLGGVAEVQVDDGYIFADAKETKRIMEMMGNVPSNNEVGLISSAKEGENWFLSFDFNPVGYVADDEKDKIDANALLESIRKGTEQANEYRKEKGFPAIHVTGWTDAPHYDSKTNNLVWALAAKDDRGGEVVNYDVRLLGRRGYLSVTLDADPEDLARLKPEVQRILGSVHYTQGNKYAEFAKGDKLAGYGLTALVAGGAGVAAAKLGLFAWLAKFLAKGWKAIVLAIVALGASLKKYFARLFGKKEGVTTPR
jgi:uncharacterized membrane-anchored protein